MSGLECSLDKLIPQCKATISIMRLIHLSFAFLFAQEIWTVNSTPDSRNLDSAGRPGSNLNPQSPSGSTSNPCDRTCNNQCLALKSEISAICNANPSNKIMTYLCNNCGMVTEGKCGTAFPLLSSAAYFPICWCHTPTESKDQRRTPLAFCRGTQIMRKLANKGTTAASDILATSTTKQTKSQMSGEAAVETVLMYQAPFPRPASRPRSPRYPPGTRRGTPPGTNNFGLRPFGFSAQEEDWNTRPDGEPEGKILWTDVQVSGNVVRAMVDTGASITLIHERFAVDMVPIEQRTTFDASKQQFRILGKTTINVEVRRGISIPVTGFVTDRKYDILLGNDFFVTYAARIKIPQETMELTNGQTRVIMKIKFRAPAGISMMGGQQSPYSDLRILVRLNGVDTRIAIDTGSSITIVNKAAVNQQTLRPVDTTCSFGGTNPVGFLGETNINLIIESIGFTVPALVPDFTPGRHLITGNDFNRQYIELINYELKTVTLKLPTSSGNTKVRTPAFVFKNQ